MVFSRSSRMSTSIRRSTSSTSDIGQTNSFQSSDQWSSSFSSLNELKTVFFIVASNGKNSCLRITWPKDLIGDTLSCSYFKRIDKRSNLLANKWNASIIDSTFNEKSLSHRSLKHPVMASLHDFAHRSHFVNHYQRQSKTSSMRFQPSVRRRWKNESNLIFRAQCKQAVYQTQDSWMGK